MLAVAIIAYVAAAVIAHVWCVKSAKPIPHPDWIWDQQPEEQLEIARRAA